MPRVLSGGPAQTVINFSKTNKKIHSVTNSAYGVLKTHVKDIIANQNRMSRGARMGFPRTGIHPLPRRMFPTSRTAESTGSRTPSSALLREFLGKTHPRAGKEIQYQNKTLGKKKPPTRTFLVGGIFPPYSQTAAKRQKSYHSPPMEFNVSVRALPSRRRHATR